MRKLSEITPKQGFTWLYRHTLRRLMPVKEPVKYADICIDVDRMYGDAVFIPNYIESFFADKPDYESSLITALRKSVEPGMSVAIVGGGVGVTCVVAAQLAGTSGAVTCYEASLVNCRRVRETANRNGVLRNLEVRHGLVGPSIGVYHDDDSAPTVGLNELERFDVLELDCEGSEKFIIQNSVFLPSRVIVETHGVYGSPTAEIEGLLLERGYEVELMGLAEPSLEAECINNDVKVLLGKKHCGRE